jgi:hypothetical protein
MDYLINVAVPTPPDPAVIKMDFPFSTCNFLCSAWYAVQPAHGTAAASVKDTCLRLAVVKSNENDLTY